MTLPSNWQTERPWRNHNPGDLRCLPHGETWDGQIGVDPTSGGYCIFGLPRKGWRALFKTLLAYQDAHGLRTIEGIANRWAPPGDGNDTSSYTAGLEEMTRFARDDVLDLHIPGTLRVLGGAIAVMEGGHLPWAMEDIEAGLWEALGLTPQVVA